MRVTKRQIKIRDFVREFFDAHGYGPLPRDIAVGVKRPEFMIDYILVNMEINQMVYRTLNHRIRVR